MSTASLGDVEVVVRTIAQVAVDNEKYFGELDAVVGDGDFGYSMARGFELVLRDWDGTSITLSRLDSEITELLAAPAEIAIRTF